MKKSFKKFGVIVLALAMVFALTAVAFAADLTTGGTSTSADEFITIPKGVTVTNSEATASIYGPIVTYSYTLGHEATTASVSNGTTTVKINEGVDNGVAFSDTDYTVSTTTIAFNNDAVTLAGGEYEIVKDLTVYVNVEAHTHAGVYRYKLEDTTTAATLSAAGIVRNAYYETVRYLDVYLVNDDAASPAHTNKLKVAGYVLITTNTTIGSDTDKNGGYTQTDDQLIEGSQSTDPAYDQYPTYNVEVTKSVTGALGDKSNAFPFAITGTDKVSDHKFKEGAAIASATDYVGSGTTLKDGESYFLYGLTAGSSMSATETNNTPDTYSVSTDGDDALNAVAKAANETATDGIANIDENKTLTFTNNLEEISITGITLRVAPYAAIGAAGFIFLAVSKKSKKEEEEA